MRLTQFSLQNPQAITAAALIVLLFGGLAMGKLPIMIGFIILLGLVVNAAIACSCRCATCARSNRATA